MPGYCTKILPLLPKKLPFANSSSFLFFDRDSNRGVRDEKRERKAEYRVGELPVSVRIPECTRSVAEQSSVSFKPRVLWNKLRSEYFYEEE